MRSLRRAWPSSLCIFAPRGLQLIRRYGLYASGTKGRWTAMPYVAERAPAGWRASHPKAAPQPDFDPFICPKCSFVSETAIIEDPQEIRRILRHLVKIGRGRPAARRQDSIRLPSTERFLAQRTLPQNFPWSHLHREIAFLVNQLNTNLWYVF